MLVVQNNIKKGIEIPEISVTIEENRIVHFSEIDKIKYAEFLALNPACLGLGRDAENEPYYTEIYEYTGDELTIPFDYELRSYGILINYVFVNN